VVGTGADLAAARDTAYRAAAAIRMRGGWYRHDIAEAAAQGRLSSLASQTSPAEPQTSLAEPQTSPAASRPSRGASQTSPAAPQTFPTARDAGGSQASSPGP
jgi:hypothetical protein